MKGKDLMIANLACCTPEHTLHQAAEMMVRRDCGEIAIVGTVENLKTDWRDHRPRYCVACSGHGKKPNANERARRDVKPSITETPDLYSALALESKRSEITDETT